MTRNFARVQGHLWRRVLLLLCLLSIPASAHLRHVSYCAVHKVPGGLDVTVQVPVQQLVERADGTRAKHDDASILADGLRYRQELEAHVRATTAAGECSVKSSGPRLEGNDERRAVFELGFDCPQGPITLSTDYFLDRDTRAEMLCAIDRNSHVFRRDAMDRLVGTPPPLRGLWLDFIELGIGHVFGGIDHVLFVLSLLLGAASAMASEPGRALRRVVGLVTGFTLGHSVTLIIAALGILTLPSRFTESVIALSIVVVAVHNILDENPRGRNLISALFGLIHGFGFASALAETGLPTRSTVSALLAFNLGIELAQLAVVGACFPALVWARRRPWFRSRLLVPACGVIAGLGALWYAKRAFGLAILPWLGS